MSERELHRLINESVKRVLREQADMPKNIRDRYALEGDFADGTSLNYVDWSGDNPYGYDRDCGPFVADDGYSMCGLEDACYERSPAGIRNRNYPDGKEGDNEYSWDAYNDKNKIKSQHELADGWQDARNKMYNKIDKHGEWNRIGWVRGHEPEFIESYEDYVSEHPGMVNQR